MAAFWDQLEWIQFNEDITSEIEIQYIVAICRVREVVDGFPPIDAIYAKAIESLKVHFSREDRLVEIYVRELLKIIISMQSTEKFPLIILYNKHESYLRALETLEIATDTCSSILCLMVESCFIAEFLKAMNTTHTASASSNAKESLNNFMKFPTSEVEGDGRFNLSV